MPSARIYVLRWCCILLTLATGVTFQGCRRHSDIVVAVPLTAGGGPMLTEHVGLKEAAFRRHLQLDWNGPGERNVDWQVERIQSAIRERAYGIVVTPFSTFGVNTSIREALAANLPVVVVGAPLPLPPSPHLSFVLESTEASAVLLQQALRRTLHPDANVAVFGMDRLSNGSEARVLAFEAALRKSSPRMRVVAHTPGPINAGYLDIAAEQMLREHPELDAVVALTSRAGVSAARAIQLAGRTGRVHLFSYDVTLEMMTLLRSGRADAVLVQDLRGMGNQAVENIWAGRHQQRVTATRTFDPVLVTRDNIDTETVQQKMILHWQHP